MVGDRQRAGVERFLIVTEGEVGRAPEGPAAGEQILRSLEHAEDLLLDIQRAAAPDVAVRHRAGEGGIGPVLLRALDHRHHVLMGHVKAGTQRFVAAGDGDEHGVVAEPLKDARAHDMGIACLHVRVELVKLAIVGQTVVGIVDGSALDRLRKTRDRALGVEVGIIALEGKEIADLLRHAILSSR